MLNENKQEITEQEQNVNSESQNVMGTEIKEEIPIEKNETLNKDNITHKYAYDMNIEMRKGAMHLWCMAPGIRFRRSGREESAFLFGERKHQIFLQLLRPQSILREAHTHR